MQQMLSDLIKTIEYDFLDWPRPVLMEQYLQARDLFLKRINDGLAVKAVYQIGEIGALGLSDLDIITVFDESQNADLKMITIKELSDFHKYIFLHEQFFVPFSIASEFKRATSIFNIQLLAGEEILFNDEYGLVENRSSILLDQIFFVLPRQFIAPLLKGKVEVRMCLARLNSFKYIVKLFCQVGGVCRESWTRLMNDIQSTRLTWFEMTDGRERRILDLLVQASVAGLELIEDYARLVGVSEGEAVYSHPWLYTRFSENWLAESSLIQTLRLYESTRVVGSYLPTFVARNLRVYATETGLQSEVVHKRLVQKGTMSTDTVVNQESIKRIEFFNRQSEMLASRGFKFGGFFDFGTTPTSLIPHIKFRLQEVRLNARLLRQK